ncbi:histidine kinase [Planctomyces sp. SCGC AG-212-M04]|nr:histidine kinase [Planctomyces sp. SCGC AG-212-M04]
MQPKVSHTSEISDDEFASLRAQLVAHQQEVSQLNDELAETNKGVVALYAELDDKNLQLREASELKSRFLSYMSHEFRTPLGAIRSIVRILLDQMDGPLNAEQLKQVAFIQGSALELSEMVDDLLDLAKIEAGRVSISPAWFEMVDLFQAIRGMFKPLLTSKAVTLVLEEPSDIPRVFSDDRKLSQILRNYISNALKFTQHGEVRVQALRTSDSDVTFSVSDTGIGIEGRYLGAVFEDFMQVDSPLQKRYRGTGLGLALCRRLATMLGGTVGVESEVGKGSTFWVRIPLTLGDPGMEGTAASPSSKASIDVQ